MKNLEGSFFKQEKQSGSEEVHTNGLVGIEEGYTEAGINRLVKACLEKNLLAKEKYPEIYRVLLLRICQGLIPFFIKAIRYTGDSTLNMRENYRSAPYALPAYEELVRKIYEILNYTKDSSSVFYVIKGTWLDVIAWYEQDAIRLQDRNAYIIVTFMLADIKFIVEILDKKLP